MGADSKLRESAQFDESRIEILGPGITIPKKELEKNPGGPAGRVNSSGGDRVK